MNEFLEHSGYRKISSLEAQGRSGWNARYEADGKIYTFDGARWSVNPGRDRPDAWIDRLLKARLAPWSKHGVIFGVPHDVHPVSLTYRDDLFREAGVDLAAAKTWDDFWHACLKFQSYCTAHGHPERHAMELSVASSEDLVMMLQQRRIDLVDSADRIHLADEKTLKTLMFYARLVAGEGQIGAESDRNAGLWVNDLAGGNICCFWTADWRADVLRKNLGDGELAGKLRMMQLPRFEASDAPTATWGGTMIGIPRNSSDPAAAWELIEFLYFSEEGLKARQAESDIVPPLPERWNDAAYEREDPLFRGQKVGQLYVDLARQIPERTVTPVTNIAQITLSVVLSRAVGRLRRSGGEGLEEACRGWLKQAEADIKRRVEHARFDADDALVGRGG